MTNLSMADERPNKQTSDVEWWLCENVPKNGRKSIKYQNNLWMKNYEWSESPFLNHYVTLEKAYFFIIKHDLVFVLQTLPVL